MIKNKKWFRQSLSFLLSIGIVTGMVCTVPLQAKSSDTEELTARKNSMLSKSAGFLSAAQNSNGSFGKNTVLLNDSAEAVFSAGLAGADIDISAARKWLSDNGVHYNNDTLARTAAALGDDGLLDELLVSQNANGGFGIRKNYDSDVLDSVLALSAVNSCAVTEKADEGSNIVYYLTDEALESGGWSYSGGSATDISLTAMAEYEIAYFMNANHYSNSIVEKILGNADSYLSENVVCSFTNEEIEHNLYAQLAHLEYNGKIDYKTIMDGLESVQSDDGGFYNSVHLTSLAVRLLNDMTFDNTVHRCDRAVLISKISLKDHQFQFTHGITSDKRIVEEAVIDEEAHVQGHKQNEQAYQHGEIICPLQRPLCVPCALFMLAETAQIHRVGDQLDPVDRREDQRDQDRSDAFDPLGKLCLGGHLQAARLLRKRDRLIVSCDIREVPQRQGERCAHFVADTDTVERRGKFTRIRGEDEDHAERNHRKIFRELRDLIEQLFQCHDVIACDREEIMSCAVDLNTVHRRKQKCQEEVCHKEDHDIHQHDSDLAEADL